MLSPDSCGDCPSRLHRASSAAECPATGSLFSLKDGSIVSWYPNNAVLRMLTPASTCRPLEIYPVHLGESAISVDVSGEPRSASGRTAAG